MSEDTNVQVAVLKTQMEGVKGQITRVEGKVDTVDSKVGDILQKLDSNFENFREKIEARFVTKDDFAAFKATKWRDLIITCLITGAITILITSFFQS